jgi:MYXO-CTERM domain-containing protein
MRVSAAILVLLATTVSPEARATYSITGTDSASRQVGGAGTSCIAPNSVYIIYGAAPGHGVVHAQALWNDSARVQAVALLADDTAPADIVAMITDPGFDAAAQSRQYGVTDLMGRRATFTGTDTMAWAGARDGVADTFAYTVQGNILTGTEVVDQAATAFESGGGCDLADRFMLAIEAGAAGGGGDSRCTPSGIPSDAAFIEVDLETDSPGAGAWLHLEVQDTAPQSPLAPLRQQFDAWRTDHPCPSPEPEPQPDAGPDVSPDAGASAAVDSGCGCRVGATTPGGWIVVLALALLPGNRRPGRSCHLPRSASAARALACLRDHVVDEAAAPSRLLPYPRRQRRVDLDRCEPPQCARATHHACPRRVP